MTIISQVGKALGAGIVVLAALSCKSESSGDAAAPPVVIPPIVVPGGPANVANRTSGVAPLGVFFDAANTSDPAFDSGVVQPGNLDYGSFRYAWNFGDPGSGTWATDGRSKNADTGFTAAHVYENPGTYTVGLTVTDSSEAVHNYSQEITVTAFSGTTYYISGGGNDGNDGLTPQAAWRNFSMMIQNMASNRRFLFERGGTYPTSSSGDISDPGPGIVGAYGSGPRPIIQCTGSNGALTVSSNDWRIMDLEFAGSGAGNNSMGITFLFHIQTREMLLYRCDIHDFWVNVGWYDYTTIYLTPHEDNFIAECEMANGLDYCAFVGGRRLAVIGNDMDTVVVNGHILRLWQADKAVVSHNILANGIHQSLKLHGPSNDSIQAKTRFVSISDNRLIGSVWTVGIGPQNDVEDERVTQVVFERNWVEANGTTQEALIIWARDITVRNNVFYANNSAPWYEAIAVQRRGIEPAAERVRILNNTVYKGDSGSEFKAFGVTSQVSNITIRNNLVSASGVSGAVLLQGSCPGLVFESNLMTNSPGFTNAGAGDFTLTSGSAARNAGMTLLEVSHDYTLSTARPQGAAFDIGAFERD